MLILVVSGPQYERKVTMFGKATEPEPSPFAQVGPTPSFVRAGSGAIEVSISRRSVVQVDPEVFTKVGPTPGFQREISRAS